MKPLNIADNMHRSEIAAVSQTELGIKYTMVRKGYLTILTATHCKALLAAMQWVHR